MAVKRNQDQRNKHHFTLCFFLLFIFNSFTVSSSLAQTMTNRTEFSMPENSIPFTIDIAQSKIRDLQDRLLLTRLPNQLDGVDWEYGAELDYVSEVIQYWKNEFDWRKQETTLNKFDQYKMLVEGIDLHFIHQRSDNENAIPLLLVHGWPGSISEFTSIIGPLTSPEEFGLAAEDAYHVIAPSLPGFGFSSAPTKPGYNPEKIANLFAEFMQQLGYEKYAIAGGDWGAVINRNIANTYPDRLIGLHTNMVIASPPSDSKLAGDIGSEEGALLENRRNFMLTERGYHSLQETKPQTVAYGLTDSPAGLAGWILEKFHGWSDVDASETGRLSDRISHDKLLTNISIYWFNQNIDSSMRIYYENRVVPPVKPISYIDVPTGVSIFPNEIYMSPRSWVQAGYDLRYWNVMPSGGHFAALEEPTTYVSELNAFFGELRDN
jgi:microsomal epoxide hydrolase